MGPWANYYRPVNDGDYGETIRRIILVPMPEDEPLAEPSPEIAPAAEPVPA